MGADYYTYGHADIGVAYEDEGSGPEFFLHYHLGANSNLGEGEYDPSEIITVVPASQKTAALDDASYNSMTGTTAGSAIWMLPESSVAGVPFLGFGTEELDGVDFPSGIQFTLDSVTSPSGNGDLSVWQTGSFGAFDFYYSTANELGTVNGDNVLTVPAGEHAHYNWGFTESGIWQVVLTASGEHATDGFLSSTKTYTFNVVPEPAVSAIALGILSLAFCLFRLRRRK